MTRYSLISISKIKNKNKTEWAAAIYKNLKQELGTSPIS